MTFDYPGYDLKFIQKQPCKDGPATEFTLVYKFFSPLTRYSYILRAEYHRDEVFAVKFYCAKDKHSLYKYSKIVNRGDLGNIIMTCVKVIPLLLKTYPQASFGFGAARTIDSKSNRVESYENNQRFRLYRGIAELKFGVITFAHFEYELISCYLLINRNCKSIALKERAVVKMFSDTYQDLPSI